MRSTGLFYVLVAYLWQTADGVKLLYYPDSTSVRRRVPKLLVGSSSKGNNKPTNRCGRRRVMCQGRGGTFPTSWRVMRRRLAPIHPSRFAAHGKIEPNHETDA